MLTHHDRPIIDRKREQWLTSAMRPADVTTPSIDAERKRYLRSVPEAERDAAQQWLTDHRDALTTVHPADSDDTLETLVTTALAPITGEREAWQRPVTLATVDGDPIDLVGVWAEVVDTLMADPIDDKSEHAGQAQRALERRRVAQAERKWLSIGTGLQTTGDLTVIDSDGAVTHLASETNLHLRQAYSANRASGREARKVAAKRAKRDANRAELQRLRAAREAEAIAARQAEREAAQRGLSEHAQWQ